MRCLLLRLRLRLQATYVLRMLLYALLPALPSVWWVLPIETLHGITFACGWGAGTVCCKQMAPHGLAATMQGEAASASRCHVSLRCASYMP